MASLPDGPDWRLLYRAYVRAGFAPAGFWDLTPPELYLALTPEPAMRPLGRSGLRDLAARFPDRSGDPT